ncbi:PAS domain-containing protein [Hydrogenimonas thermophila]|uniref:PAS domain-containing protein n=1 Tax=Hydrogenimonas thermophila TaxID=223786 RepID=UPI00293710C1|nr:PAS domain-containing protein [Hydrogenimonas thermophila]WOE69218.1 PAS domain-containing protein [Hydrogenimonas thermophila]WOE71728.1 PAS domain-containing protein [Hydrogenimonas thermophila]
MESKRRRLSKLDAPKNITSNEKIMDDNDFIVSKTDTKGYITYFNEVFMEMAGYTHEELMGANHNLIRHPHMPRIAFKLAWDLIQNGKEFFGFVKNLRKDGGFYWVFAYITPDYDSSGNIIGYTSFRRKPPRSAIEQIEPIYRLLVDEERKGGMDASLKLLQNFLKEHKISYNTLVMSLQMGAKL